jgi:hypothetical protein
MIPLIAAAPAETWWRRYHHRVESAMNDSVDGERSLLRHTLATLAYRAEKVLRNPPAEFAVLRVAPDLRSPLDLVGHLGDLLEWAEQLAAGRWVWNAASIGEWDADVERFYAALTRLDVYLASDAPLGHPAGVIFQGPIADALTHVGQLALLRRLAGAPVRPESYGRAEIRVGRVGREQSDKRPEFDGDASAR